MMQHSSEDIPRDALIYKTGHNQKFDVLYKSTLQILHASDRFIDRNQLCFGALFKVDHYPLKWARPDHVHLQSCSTLEENCKQYLDYNGENAYEV